MVFRSELRIINPSLQNLMLPMFMMRVFVLDIYFLDWIFSPGFLVVDAACQNVIQELEHHKRFSALPGFL